MPQVTTQYGLFGQKIAMDRISIPSQFDVQDTPEGELKNILSGIHIAIKVKLKHPKRKIPLRFDEFVIAINSGIKTISHLSQDNETQGLYSGFKDLLETLNKNVTRDKQYLSSLLTKVIALENLVAEKFEEKVSEDKLLG